MKKRKFSTAAQWPIDTRVLPDIFSFSHVKGVARMFLLTEISLSVCVVIGTGIMVIISLFG